MSCIFVLLSLVLCNVGSLVVNYPFDDNKERIIGSLYSKSPDDEVFKQISRAYSEVIKLCCFGITLRLK